MVKITVDPEMCKGCGICLEFCPKKVYDWSKEYTARGVKNPVPLRIKDCIKCRLCELMCPDMAITVEDED